MTQCELVLQYIKDFGSITTKEAFDDLGVARLASRINDLANAGYQFEKRTESSRNRYGRKVNYTRYSLPKSTEVMREWKERNMWHG